MKRSLFFSFCFALLLPIRPAYSQTTGPSRPRGVPRVIRFVHGLWFDGTTFVAKDITSVNGVFSNEPAKTGEEIVDLKGGFVVPPFGDAHEHNFDSVKQTPSVTNLYLSDGIFYAQGLTDLTSGSAAVRKAHLVNTHSTVDVTYAHGGLTGVNGHPKDTYEGTPLGIFYASTREQKDRIVAAHDRAGDAYWEIDSPATLEADWPKILAAKPDLIKIFLHESENFQPQPSPALGGGLDPALVPLIVHRAHAAGLKVVAHVDTAADFHHALVAEVDELAHLPGYCLSADQDPLPYRLADADIALAASHHVTLIPTAAQCDSDRSTPLSRDATRRSQVENLTRLKAAGVNIVVGSDTWGQDSLHEARYLHSLGLWTNLEMLRMWAVDTPIDVFPRRRIAKLEPGHEASFLVLTRNPLLDWSATEEIEQRWKRGHPIEDTLH